MAFSLSLSSPTQIASRQVLGANSRFLRRRSGLGGLLMTNCIHSKDAAVFRRRRSFNVLFGALVHASGRAELDGIKDQSINLDLGLYEPD